MAGPLTEATAGIMDEVRARAEENEEARKIPEHTFDMLRETGFFRALVPARFAGDELQVDDVLQAVRTLASADAATGWVAGLLAVHQHVIAYFDPRVQEEFWASGPDTIMTTSGEPIGRAEQVEDGIRLSGRWRFSSGSDYAKWVLVGFKQPDSATGEPAGYFTLVPEGDFRIEDTWFTYGLRGTGSKDIVIEDAFVPEHRWIRWPGTVNRCPGMHANGLYHLPFTSVFTAAFAAVALGAAEGALAAHREKLLTRVRNYSGVSGLNPVAQLRFGDSSLEVRAAAALLERHWMGLAWHASEDVPVPEEQEMLWRQEDGYAGELVTRAVERLVKSGGGSVTYSSGALQRFWRDIHTIRGHVWFDMDTFAQQHARQELGLDPDPSLIP